MLIRHIFIRLLCQTAYDHTACVHTVYVHTVGALVDYVHTANVRSAYLHTILKKRLFWAIDWIGHETDDALVHRRAFSILE